MPSPQRVKGSGCLFSNLLRLCCCRCRRAAVRPLACCLLPAGAARMPGIHMFEVGLRRWVGALAGWEREGVPTPTRESLNPCTEEKAKLVPSSSQLPETHCLSSRNSSPVLRVETVPPASLLPRLQTCLRDAAAHGRCTSPGKC